MRAGVLFLCLSYVNDYKYNIARSMEMKNNERLFYEAPSTNVVEVRYGAFVCASGKTEKFGSGYSYDDSYFD